MGQKEKLVIRPKRFKGETIVISTRFSMELVDKIDELVKKTGRTRSEILSICLEYAIDNIIIDDKE